MELAKLKKEDKQELLVKLYEGAGTLTEIKNQEIFNSLVNIQPPAAWVKEHPFIKGHRYLPIDKVEFLLRSIFKTYTITITDQGTAFNGVYVTVRITYTNPITGSTEYQDGIGAAQLQTKKGTSPAEMQNINNGALQMAFPVAKTLAIKDAADHIGTVFGSDLNRKEVMMHQPSTVIMSQNSVIAELIAEANEV